MQNEEFRMQSSTLCTLHSALCTLHSGALHSALCTLHSAFSCYPLRCSDDERLSAVRHVSQWQISRSLVMKHYSDDSCCSEWPFARAFVGCRATLPWLTFPHSLSDRPRHQRLTTPRRGVRSPVVTSSTRCNSDSRNFASLPFGCSSRKNWLRMVPEATPSRGNAVN